jgi:hypothetical protein
VESFFGMKMDMLVDEFILMQDKFRLKSELYETEQEVKKKKKQKKLEEVADPEESKRLLNETITHRLNTSYVESSGRQTRVASAMEAEESEKVAYGLIG